LSCQDAPVNRITLLLLPSDDSSILSDLFDGYILNYIHVHLDQCVIHLTKLCQDMKITQAKIEPKFCVTFSVEIKYVDYYAQIDNLAQQLMDDINKDPITWKSESLSLGSQYC
jgi:hypothetical protein